MKVRHALRYASIGRLLLEHSGNAVIGGDAADGDAPSVRRDGEALARELEAMGPTFVKLGQLLSTRADVLPPAYLDALGRLQDRVAPIPFDEVERIVADELGMRLSKAFGSFESRPAGSASLAQVHRAALRDGRPVAVKVQRPDVRARVVDDMDVIEELAEFVDEHTAVGRRYRFGDMVTEFRRSLMDELDYRQEAKHLVALGRNLADHPRIVVPQPVDDYTTSRVLTMEWIAGRSVASLGPLGRLELDGRELAEALFAAYLDQILVHGLFHADPHPGNVFVTRDGRLALIDLGMVGRVDPGTQDALIKLLLAVSSGHGAEAADALVGLGEQLPGFDRDALRRGVLELLGRNVSASVDDLQAGALLGEVLRVAGNSGLRPHRELTMIAKTLLNLDEVARLLDPSFAPLPNVERYASSLMRKKLLQTASPDRLLAGAIEAKEFAEKLPGRVNRLMDALAEGTLTLKVQGVDEKELMRGVQKLANRLTTGLVVAALVVGASLIMRVDARPKLFGYPAVAIVLFLLAALAAAWLLVSIALSDLPQHRRRR